jgi:hypothetical protein
MARYSCFGYTCTCGEKVTAFRIPMNLQVEISRVEMTIHCANGHERKIQESQMEQLDQWTESELGEEN